MRVDAWRGGGAAPHARRLVMPLAAWLLVSVVGAVLVALEFPPGDWFSGLAQPASLPPLRVLALGSCALLALCGAAAWRVDRGVRGRRRACALRLFLVQLALGFAWLAILLGAHGLGPAIAVMAVLWLTVVATTVAFARVDRAAGLLATPFLAWMTFLFEQNILLWTLN
jgi:tryptophan-rich sensory protein